MSVETRQTPDSVRRTFPPVDVQLEALMRGVDYGDPRTADSMRLELRDRLEDSARTGRPLRAYVGIDPTGADLTLGHTVPLRKLRQVQDLGHQAIFVIGDMTALVGDPSDKSAARRMLTADEVLRHGQAYLEQAGRVLDAERVEVRRNSEWLGRLDLAAIIDLASHFTVGQFLQRDNFALRHGRGDAIWLHEFFYALMQAHDAVALEADIQIGGTEQLFNLMAGRKLQEARGQRPQVPLTLPILVGTDGHARMSKSAGNFVGIAEPPASQFGKAMSIPDEAMANWLTLVTNVPEAEIATLLGEVGAGRVHPMAAKKRLAREIVTLFHGADAAAGAEAESERTVQGRAQPDSMPVHRVLEPTPLLDLLQAAGLVASRSEARRLMQQGGVRLDEVALEDPSCVIEPGPPRVLQVGKRRFLRLE